MLASILLVALGGSIGAVARYGMVVFTHAMLGTRFPYGTLLVNSLGSFLAGILMIFIMDRVAENEVMRLFLMVGFLGAYTTFSSFSWETLTLFLHGDHVKACMNVVLNNVAALGLILIGAHLARWIKG